MSLDKSIEHGREHRKPYRGAKAIDSSCRNHGGKTKRNSHRQCLWCRDSFLYHNRKEDAKAEEMENES